MATNPKGNKVDLMIDIETLGTTPGCAILSIAAVPFSVHSPIEHFYERISQQSCIEAGLHVDSNTVNWWAKQSYYAQKEAFSGTERIEDVLARLTLYIKQLGTVRPWGNGASFDVPILEAAYAKCGMKAPWAYYNAMCYRTLKNLFPYLVAIEPVIKHNALEDAKSQAAHAEKLMMTIRIRE
jgi:hypothetical protein